MKFIKSVFFMLGLASFVSVSWVCVADAYTNCTQSVPAGYYCQTATIKPPCPKNCYCIGDSSDPYNATGSDGNHGTPEDFCNYGHNDSWFFNRAGMYRCPDSHPYTLGTGRSNIYFCYKSCSSGDLYYNFLTGGLPAGKYLPARSTEPTDCPAGKYCAGSQGDMVNSCSDQGITGQCNGATQWSDAGSSECSTCYPGSFVTSNHDACNDCPLGYECTDGSLSGRRLCTGNQYTDTTGSTACSVCEEPGKAVTTTTTQIALTGGGYLKWNTGCDVCDAGMYANNGHTECVDCEVGYACTSGIRTKCEGNEYTSASNSTTCAVCEGEGMAVITQDDQGSNGVGSQTNVLNVGCQVCTDGTYAKADHTVCLPCPAGHKCSGGKDLGLCPAGTCAAHNNACVASGGSQCKDCPDNKYSIPEKTDCVMCDQNDKYFDSDGECKDCPDIAFDGNLYERVRIGNYVGAKMCGIRLDTGHSKCHGNSVVAWYTNVTQWKLVDGSSAVADKYHYVKDPLPTSPNGNDVDWCDDCPSGKFNIYTNRTGVEACITCPAGYCTSNNSCDPCTAGYYCPGTNGEADACVIGVSKFVCPKGSFSSVGQSRCTNCAAGYTTCGSATPYYPDADSCTIPSTNTCQQSCSDISTICQKVHMILMFENTPIPLNYSFQQGKMNSNVLTQQ